MNRLLITLFFPALLVGQKSFGQDSAPKVSVVVSPALLVPVSVAVQGGLLCRVGSSWSVLAEAAVPAFYPHNTEYEKISYWRTSAELRYAYRRKKGLCRYAAVQAGYLFRELTDEGQAFYYTKSQTFAYTNAVINSPVLSTALKLGLEIPAGKHFFADVFAGGGLRFIFTSYKTKSALVTSLEPKEQSLFKFDDAWLYNYTLKRFHATAGVRLGYRL